MVWLMVGEPPFFDDFPNALFNRGISSKLLLGGPWKLGTGEQVP